jgi:hypothetical protein
VLIANQAMHAGVKIPGASEKLDRLPASMRTPLGRDTVLEKLDSNCATPLSDLADSLAARSADEFERLLPTACDACGVRLRPLDKNKERQLVLHRKLTCRVFVPCSIPVRLLTDRQGLWWTDRQALMKMLSTESSPTDAVRRSAQLLACTRLSIVVDIPVKTVSALVAHLATECAGEEDSGVESLQEYHAQVRQYLLCLQRGEEAAAAEKLDELERDLDGLRESVLAKVERAGGEKVANESNCDGVDEHSTADQSSNNLVDNEGEAGSHGLDGAAGSSKKAKKSKKGKKRAD